MRGDFAILPFTAPRFMRFLRPLASGVVRSLTGEERRRGRDGFQLAIVIPLADEAGHDATKLQIEILRKYGRNPGLDAWPHITLKMGFTATDTAPFENYIGQLAGEVPPFEISIKNFDFFDEGILFLDVEDNPALEKLRQRVLSDLSELYGIQAEAIEGGRFRFHVTLAYGLSSRDFGEMQKSYASRQIQFKFKARHIDLFCHAGQQWVTLKSATLGDNLHAHP